MKKQTLVTDTKKIITSIMVLLGAVIIFTAPLLHISFPKKPDYQIEFEKKIAKYNIEKDIEFCQLEELFNLNRISPLDYIKRVRLLQIDREVETQLLNYQLSDLIDKNRVFGFRNMRIFLIGFGIRLPYILFSFIILFFFLYSREKLKKNKYLYRATIILYSISFFISFYIIIWFILPRDLPLTVYHLLIGLFSVLSSLLSVFCIKYYYNHTSNFKVRELIRFITTLRKQYVLDFAVTATEANPNLKNDIKTKLGHLDDELTKTMVKVSK